LRNAVFIYAIDNKLKLPISDENTFPEDFIDDADINDIFSNDDEQEEEASGDNLIQVPNDMAVYMKKAEEYYNGLIGKNNVQWIDAKYFKRTLKQQLKKDCEQLIAMINLCEAWNPQTDQKLNELQELLCAKHQGDKVIVFTQYSDTANYIYHQLKKRGIQHIDKATDGSKNPTATGSMGLKNYEI
jgi:superfamily II DNA or RNA helicase